MCAASAAAASAAAAFAAAAFAAAAFTTAACAAAAVFAAACNNLRVWSVYFLTTADFFCLNSPYRHHCRQSSQMGLRSFR